MIKVITFGKFEILNEQGCVNDENIRSGMLKKLILYIMMHRNHPLTVPELCDALWQEDEIDNPAGALKNLMYRLRNLLKTELGGDQYILSKKGYYFWNTEYEAVLDCEEFEKNLDKAKKNSFSNQERITYYEEAVKLYNGEFMLSVTDVFWILTRSAFYHSALISGVKELTKLYFDEGFYSKAEEVSVFALQLDPLDEQLNGNLVQAYIRQNKQKQAMDSYENIEKILYDQLGVRNTKRLQELKQELRSMDNGQALTNIDEMSSEITETDVDGAYFCGYAVFREIYRLEARKIRRLGMSEYLVLFTISMDAKVAQQIGEEQEKKYMRRAMDVMERMLCETLRIGDVVARYSSSQFVVMLTSCNYENCAMVTNRALSKFYRATSRIRGLNVKLDWEEVVAASTIVR